MKAAQLDLRERDELVPDPQVRKEFDVTFTTLWRWERDPTLDFPPKVQIRGRNYRSRRLLEAFKQRMLAKAVKNRNARVRLQRASREA